MGTVVSPGGKIAHVSLRPDSPGKLMKTTRVLHNAKNITDDRKLTLI